MELQELYDSIHLQPEIIKQLKVIQEETDMSRIEIYLEQLLDMKTAPQSYRYLKNLFQEDADQMKMLYCQLECARRIFDRYQKKNIPKMIYIDTMKCFARFLEECREKNGRIFFDRGWWTYRQTSMNIFRIGALEYQFEEYEGADVIGIHIPSDADLSKEAVDDSLRQAAVFFRTYYRNYEYEKYTCDSWLLSPVLKPFLSEKSHILSFQRRFDIVSEDKSDKEYIEWLFQVPADTAYANLPAETQLQRKVKELLLHGGTVGCAYGIMKKGLLPIKPISSLSFFPAW